MVFVDERQIPDPDSDPHTTPGTVPGISSDPDEELATSHELVRNHMRSGERFLLVEFDQLREQRGELASISDRRIDVHVALVTLIAGGLVWMAQLHLPRIDYCAVALLSLGSLLAMGLSTFGLIVGRDILFVEYTRAINRIRAYFGQFNPQIQPYVLMPVSHTYPRYRWVLSNTPIVVLMNALVTGVIGGIIELLISATDLPDQWTILSGLIAIGLAFLGQTVYAQMRFALAERKANRVRALDQALFGSHAQIGAG